MYHNNQAYTLSNNHPAKPDRPTRASSRLRGLDPPPFEITEDDSISGTNEASTNTVVDPELWDGRLLTGDEYFDEETRKNAIRVDGHYAGKRNVNRDFFRTDPCFIHPFRLDQSRTCRKVSF